MARPLSARDRRQKMTSGHRGFVGDATDTPPANAAKASFGLVSCFANRNAAPAAIPLRTAGFAGNYLSAKDLAPSGLSKAKGPDRRRFGVRVGLQNESRAGEQVVRQIGLCPNGQPLLRQRCPRSQFVSSTATR